MGYIRMPDGKYRDINGNEFHGPKKANAYDKRLAAAATLSEYSGQGGVTPGFDGSIAFNPDTVEATIRKNHPKFNDEMVAHVLAGVSASRDLMNGIGERDLGETANARARWLAEHGGGPSAPLFDTSQAGPGVPFFEQFPVAAPSPSVGKQVVEVIVKPATGFNFLEFVQNSVGNRRNGAR